jgi:hypothetical protein
MRSAQKLLTAFQICELDPQSKSRSDRIVFDHLSRTSNLQMSWKHLAGDRPYMYRTVQSTHPGWFVTFNDDGVVGFLGFTHGLTK